MKTFETILGYVKLNDEKYAFVLEEHGGKIFCDKYKVFGATPAIDDLIYGTTTDNQPIAIRIHNPFTMFNIIVFCYSYYVIGNWTPTNALTFKKIDFIGGTLNSIISPQKFISAVNLANLYEQGGNIALRPIKEVGRFYRISVYDTPINISFVYAKPQANGRYNLGTLNSCVSIEFENNQQLDSFTNWLTLINKILAILVAQQNTKIDRILISGENNPFAEIHAVSRYRDSVDKNTYECIDFNLVENVFENFIHIVEDDEFSVGFLPTSNDAWRNLTYDDIKNICTALEFEYSCMEDKLKQSAVVKQLVKQILGEVTEFSKSHNELTENDYNSIRSNIKNWTIAAESQVWALYLEYKDIMDEIFGGPYQLTFEQIQRFIKLRNEITHGKRPRLLEEHRLTAHKLKGLVYISLLDRIGVKKNDIMWSIPFIFRIPD